MKKNKTIAGFTLVEMVVVIAIFGILTTMVLTAVGGARNRARDARIISNVNQIRSFAEILYGRQGNYAGLTCGANNGAAVPTDMQSVCTDIFSQINDGTTVNVGVSGVDVYKYCVSSKLTSGRYYCADSAGKGTEDASNLCDGSNYDC